LNWAKVCAVVLLAAGTARAQRADVRQLRDLSMRWVEYYAAIYRVPIELVEAIIDEESGWKPYAVSSKGAAGIMQLMPGTAVRFGVHNRFRVDENIHGGVAYLAWLSERFKGDLRLMTAAYCGVAAFSCAQKVLMTHSHTILVSDGIATNREAA
jgi:soluble lytic murein transglycosylase-like protein